MKTHIKDKKERPMKRIVAYSRNGIISASIWRRARRFANGKTGYFESVTTARSYKDRENGEWHNTNSYSLAELKLLKAVIENAIKEIDKPFQSAADMIEAGEAEEVYDDVEPVEHVGLKKDSRVRSQFQSKERGDVCVVC